MRPCHGLLIMVDGLGLPPQGERRTVYEDCSTLKRLFQQYTVPLDAGLGVPGIPQSATGQTTLLTGINAAEMLGGHLAGFPNARLRAVVERENLFVKLLSRGYSCTFANAYARLPEMNLPLSLRSVTTVASMAAFAALRQREDLLAGRAVYHDLTRQWLREKGDEKIPVIDEETAARHLLALMRTVDLTLFEYFLTDHAGHRGTEAEKKRVLRSLDRFLRAVLAGLDRRRELLLLVSDHGNIENLRNRHHSLNPVPWSSFGHGAEAARQGMRSLVQVTPKVLELFSLPDA